MSNHELDLDLDDLMKESTQFAAAKKAKAQGRKLKDGQELLLAVMKGVEDRDMWETQEVFLHTVAIRCNCGAERKEFRGWYHYAKARIGSGRRLERHVEPDHVKLKGVVVKHFTTAETVGYCMKCVPVFNMKWADISDCDLLKELIVEPPAGEVVAVQEALGTPIVEEDEEDGYLTQLNSDEPSWGDV